MYAVIETGGKQYRVEPGTVLDVEKLPAEEGETIRLDRLLLVADDEGGLTVGAPYVPAAQAVATVLRQFRGPKIRIFKYKPKANYRRRRGHRQSYTRIRVERIELAR
ncbi:ribosomal protein L21 (BL20) [Candidatus Hydrogenisulfobacillus filiaventi]|uniref:Large ribosomal subunit protein bL21 n=1 Tax=Candidatus Hydrogenisulfobacillus filiaventi TaxID=2707344 RepID=A0A6F8ZJ19_9FIRM|nr:50S ribosomal protein L21 [Bacillota bacterium]CAB1129671.1 ribosomal protein L21 (BL20) [Candidatus Hydrogenisulfobacillus filiaventi]